MIVQMPGRSYSLHSSVVGAICLVLFSVFLNKFCILICTWSCITKTKHCNVQECFAVLSDLKKIIWNFSILNSLETANINQVSMCAEDAYRMHYLGSSLCFLGILHKYSSCAGKLFFTFCLSLFQNKSNWNSALQIINLYRNQSVIFI